MAKKQIVLIAVVVIIFAGIVTLGVINMPQTATPNPANQPAENNQQGPPDTTGQNPSEVPDWQKSEAPVQSVPLTNNEVPETGIKIVITEKGIAPASFEVQKGEEIMLVVASGDQWTHIFKFKDPQLVAVAVGVGPQETRAITFTAPAEKGEYAYYCDVPGHEARGEVGKMIVK